MEDLLIKKVKIEELINNSIWENLQFNLSYKFQNKKDLWINGNTHFNYKIELIENEVHLLLYPNGEDFIAELRYDEILYLQGNKQKFELRLRTKL